MKRLEEDISRESHSTPLINTVKWETVPFYRFFTGTILYGNFSFLWALTVSFLYPDFTSDGLFAGTLPYGDFACLRAFHRFFTPGALPYGELHFSF